MRSFSFLLFLSSIFCNFATFLHCPKLSCTITKFLAITTLGISHYTKVLCLILSFLRYFNVACTNAQPGFLATTPVYLARLWMVHCLFTTYVPTNNGLGGFDVGGGGEGIIEATSSTTLSPFHAHQFALTLDVTRKPNKRPIIIQYSICIRPRNLWFFPSVYGYLLFSVEKV
jgi:hypothetical protein